MGKLSAEPGSKPYHPDKETIIRQLFERYYRPLVFYAVEYVLNPEQAKDIVQDLFIRLWSDDYLLNIDPDKVSSYLYTSVRNSCLSFLSRKDVMHNTVEIKDFEIPVELAVPIENDILTQARKVLEQMPPRTKEAMEYVIMQEHSYKEAAEKMGISVNTVKFLLKEGMKKARKISPAIAVIFNCLLQK